MNQETHKKEDKLSREEAITRFIKDYGLDIRKVATGIRVKCESHHDNYMAPEAYCYKITYTAFGSKHRFAFWPNTVSFQGY